MRNMFYFYLCYTASWFAMLVKCINILGRLYFLMFYNCTVSCLIVHVKHMQFVWCHWKVIFSGMFLLPIRNLFARWYFLVLYLYPCYTVSCFRVHIKRVQFFRMVISLVLMTLLLYFILFRGACETCAICPGGIFGYF